MQNSNKLPYEEFVRRAIIGLRKEGYKGIHVVYSGFNDAFRAYYKEDPVRILKKLKEEGKVEIRYVSGGALLFLPEEAPLSANAKVIDALKTIGVFEGAKDVIDEKNIILNEGFVEVIKGETSEVKRKRRAKIQNVVQDKGKREVKTEAIATVVAKDAENSEENSAKNAEDNVEDNAENNVEDNVEEVVEVVEVVGKLK